SLVKNVADDADQASSLTGNDASIIDQLFNGDLGRLSTQADNALSQITQTAGQNDPLHVGDTLGSAGLGSNVSDDVQSLQQSLADLFNLNPDDLTQIGNASPAAQSLLNNLNSTDIPGLLNGGTVDNATLHNLSQLQSEINSLLALDNVAPDTLSDTSS